MEGKTILAFVPRGKKFTECSSYTEVTTQVDCKVSTEKKLNNKEGVEEVPVLYEEFSTGEYTRILVKANTKV